MATLYRNDGVAETVTPKNGRDFKLYECYKLLQAGTIEHVSLGDGTCLIIDEEGKFNSEYSVNREATRLFVRAYGNVDVIVGPALHCKESEFR